MEKQVYDKLKQRVDELIRTGEPGEAAEFHLTEVGVPTVAVKAMKLSPEWEEIKKIEFTLAYDYEVLGDGAIPQDTAKAITIPTLVMNGEKGVPFMGPAADQIAKLISGAERKTLEGQQHQVEAEAVAPVLIEFFGEEK